MVVRLMRKLMFSRLGFFGAGVAVMYLLDPDRGTARRAELAQRAGSAARQQARNANREVTYLQGRAKGTAAKAAGAGRYSPESETGLREHLKQVVGGLPFRTADITVDVAGGRVGVRGQVEDAQQRSQLLDAIRQVDGVEDIDDFTHLPGEPAPNKASVLLD